MKHYIITVARGFGSGGKQIAMKLAEELGIECYEHRILAYATQKYGLEQQELEEVDEKLRGSYLSNQLKRLQRSLLPIPEDHHFVSDDQLFSYQADVIKRLCEEESCIIVGKCADYILRDRDDVVGIYIEAPRAFCRQRIMNRMQVSADEADRLIEKTDRYRAEYYKYYTKGNYWTNPVNYDLTLNSEKVGMENCVKVIKNYLDLKFGQE